MLLRARTDEFAETTVAGAAKALEVLSRRRDEYQRVYEETLVSLKAKGARERTVDKLRTALVPNPAGSPVRVADLAAVDEREGLATISREDQQYVRIVSYDFRGPQKLATRTHEAFMKSITPPAGYTVSDQQRSEERRVGKEW